MAKTQLTKNTTTGNWELTETNQPQHYTNTLQTAGKLVDGDIKINVKAKDGTLENPTVTKTVDLPNHRASVVPKAVIASGNDGWLASQEKTGNATYVYASEVTDGEIEVPQYNLKWVSAGSMWASSLSNRFCNEDIWTDGTTLYYSHGTDQFYFDKSTKKWRTKTWSGMTSFYGRDVWVNIHDGQVYYGGTSDGRVATNSSSSYCKVLSGNIWSSVSFTSVSYPLGRHIITDGINMYYVNGSSTVYMLNKAYGARYWTSVTWNVSGSSGEHYWTIGNRLFYNDIRDRSGNRAVYTVEGVNWDTGSMSSQQIYNAYRDWTDNDYTDHSTERSNYRQSILYINGKTYLLYSNTSADEIDVSTMTWVKTVTIEGEGISRKIWTDGEDIYSTEASTGYPSSVKLERRTTVTNYKYGTALLSSNRTISNVKNESLVKSKINLANCYPDPFTEKELLFENKDLTIQSSNQYITPTRGKLLAGVKVPALNLTTGSGYPGSSAKNLTPSSGYYWTKFTIYAVSNSNISGYSVQTSRTNGSSTAQSISRYQMALVLSDSCTFYYGSSSSLGSSVSVAGGALVYNDGSNWYILNYQDTKTLLISGTGTLYYRTNSGKYTRKITNPIYKDA